MKQKRSGEESSNGDFQEWWTVIYVMIKKGDKVLCVLCSDSLVCRTSSMKQHYETNDKWLHEKNKKNIFLMKLKIKSCNQVLFEICYW
jgi:hypothetical protein